MMNREERLKRIQELQAETATLISQLQQFDAAERADASWPPKTFYWWYHITTGAILGGVGAVVSLFFNVIGSVLFDKHPFELIRVFMTFPMGGSAFTSESDVTLIIGIILYIVTGSFYGIVFEAVIAKYFKNSSRSKRIVVAIGI